ncbi:MAG: hypothetical protein BWY74_00663 [Firmicutes bacterium ADurb.Bin419]|nr:MAG: hypothetical protein BWY74_00663 [Firmicutes bacterium ADurb.Bin419]
MKKEDQINTYNLFRCGNNVPWPEDNEPGFLSFKRCSNLWNLGARPYMKDKESILLIEDIITCANMSASAKFYNDNIYINAYKELAIYLKHLFIYYNNMIKSEDLTSEKLLDWGWYKFFKKVAEDDHYNKVVIVTYNYDIWLERILNALGVKFNIGKMQRKNKERKFLIIKPHGSISFTHKDKLDRKSFRIRYDRELSEGNAKDFRVKYTDLDENYLINAMIPPAGDSKRLKFGWASELRDMANKEAALLGSDDEMIICGISYWHVDRIEIDELLTIANPELNVKLINPYPPRALNAVLSSLFKKYLCYTSSQAIGV